MKHAPINTATAPTSDLLAALAFASRAAKAAWRSTTPVLSRVEKGLI